MSDGDDCRPVTVGVADEQHAALMFAAAEADRIGCGLEIVHAYSVPPAPPDAMGAVYGVDIRASFRDAGRDVLAGAAGSVHDDYPELVTTSLLVQAPAAQALVERSMGARLVVLGPDDARPWYSRLFESRVSRRLANESSCPVVVVPDTWQVTAACRGVTLMLDSETVAHGPLRYAFRTADRYDVELRIVHIVSSDVAPPGSVAWTDMVALIDSWGARYPRVRVRTMQIDGLADLRTVESLEDTGVLVVGRPHERHVLDGLRRAFAEQVIDHASCPVAVVPAHHDW